MENPVQLTPRFTQAVDCARQVHVNLRKGTQVPYMAHLLGVASLVLGETGHHLPRLKAELTISDDPRGLFLQKWWAWALDRTLQVD